MYDLDKLSENLKKRSFDVARFATGAEAAAYIDSVTDGVTVGIGGSMTVKEMGLYERLVSHNTVHWHWAPDAPEDARARAAQAQVYISSVNGLSMTGEIVNIDGAGNRVASTIYGHEKVIFVVGSNKIAPDFAGAMDRARNVAAPKNARRIGCATPCAALADRCYDCSSPERICRAAVTFWEKPTSIREALVVLIDEPMGY